MKTKKLSYPVVHIGTSFMLVIFLILCMVLLAILSFSTAWKDYRESTAYAESTSAYYEACNQAEEILGTLDSSELTFPYAFSVSISDTEELQVVLDTDSSNENGYQITSFKKVSTADWSGDSSLPVLGSE